MSRVHALVRRPLRLLVVTTIAAASTLTTGLLAAGAVGAGPEPAPTAADACYTWERDLQSGDSGEDVKQLQIRVFGYPAPGEQLAVDGEFGPATADAVTRFQQAYGLPETGKGETATYEKIYELQDDDCTPIHFDYSELNTCNSDWSGGKVSAEEAKANALNVMWGLEAMRHALGDEPIRVTSGFRSIACNDAVGGAPDSQHLYGRSADLGVDPHSLCTLAQQARDHGFLGIFGPGYPGHDDHTHVDIRPDKVWDAPDCGVSAVTPGVMAKP